MSIRAMIIDDEPLAIRGLALRLEAFEDVTVIGSAANGREAVKAVREQRPDLIFLDIQMPGFDGFAVLRALLGEEALPFVIFVTAFDQHALQAFEAKAVDYLLKPVDPERLRAALQHVREQMAQRRAFEQQAKLMALVEGMGGDMAARLVGEAGADLDKTASSLANMRAYAPELHIHDRGHITIIPVEAVDYIEAAGDYLCIHTSEKTHILRETMKTMTDRLDPRLFERVHRSHIVNIKKVKEVTPHANGESFLLLTSGAKVKVSRSYKQVIGRFL